MKLNLGLLFQSTEADSLAQMLEDDTSMSFFEILTQGGLLMIPLFILSVLAIYVIAERWRTLENSKMDIAATTSSRFLNQAASSAPSSTVRSLTNPWPGF